jgi:hypothetical protein
MGSEDSPGGQNILERKAQYGLIRRGNEIWQYTEDDTGPHGSGQRRCFRTRQRLDGFVSLDAGIETGRIRTRPFVFEGQHLALNVLSNGEVRVAILDETGNSLPGYGLPDCDPIQGDSIDQKVSWKGRTSVRPLEGTVVQLEFEMQDAKLFAFEFLDEARSLLRVR